MRLVVLILLVQLALALSIATYSNRFNAVLTPITTSVWGIERPFVWNNIDVGSRATVMRLTDGTLAVHSPVEIDDTLRDLLASLGIQSMLSLTHTHTHHHTFTHILI